MSMTEAFDVSPRQLRSGLGEASLPYGEPNRNGTASSISSAHMSPEYSLLKPRNKPSLDANLGRMEGEIKAWGRLPKESRTSIRTDFHAAIPLTGAVARLAAKLQQGATSVKVNERADANQSPTHTRPMSAASQSQREAALSARLKAAEAQLADTHSSLQAAQEAQRGAAAKAAELGERVRAMQSERDEALSKLESATSLLHEACDRAEAVGAERDAARREAANATAEATAVQARLRQAEALEDRMRQKEAALADRRAEMESESRKIREAAREAERAQAELGLREGRLEKRETEADERHNHLVTRDRELQGRETAASALAARLDRDRRELETDREALRREAADIEAAAQALRQHEKAAQAARVKLTEKRTKISRELEAARDECRQLEAAAAVAKERAEVASARARDAEAAAKASYDHTLAEERRLREIQMQCMEERRCLAKLEEDESALQGKVQAARAQLEIVESDARARRTAADEAERKASLVHRQILEEREAVQRERASLEELSKALTLQERQALEAAEAARREQIVLACARKDSARAAAEMQQRHLEAAVHLEGSAARAAFDAAKAEEALGLFAARNDRVQGDIEMTGDRSPPGSASPVKVACQQVANEVESSLGRWHEQLQQALASEASLGEGSNSASSVSSEESVKLLRTPGNVGDWPSIFSFPAGTNSKRSKSKQQRQADQ